MPAPAPAKTCVLCGRDCSGQPRVKDAHGRYMHQACAKQHEQRTGAKAAPPEAGSPRAGMPAGSAARARTAPASDKPGPRPASAAPAGGVMDHLVAEALQSAPVLCENCGQSRPRNAVLCTHCGFNSQTGKAVRTRVEKVRRDRSEGGGKAQATAGAALWLAGPAFWLVGGLVGGAAGAGLWAMLVYQLQIEVGWIAIVTGMLTGAGVFIGTRGEGGLVPGLLAVVLAVGAILAGKYVGVSMLVDDAIKEAELEPPTFVAHDLTEDDLLQYLADEIVVERMEAGRAIAWPEPLIDEINEYEEVDLAALDVGSRSEILMQYATWPEDYPDDLREETHGRLGALDAKERDDLRHRVAAEWTRNADEFSRAIAGYVKEAGFVSTFGVRDVLYFACAIVLAFGVGGKGGLD